MPILIFYIINPPLFLSTIFFLYLLHNQVLPQNIKGHHSMLMWKREQGSWVKAFVETGEPRKQEREGQYLAL